MKETRDKDKTKDLKPIETNTAVINLEDAAMSVDKVLGQIRLIQEIMTKAMHKDEHYGIIPGTKKPTLLKPGAEKLCLTFRLNPDYEVLYAARERDFIAYTIKCLLIHIPSGQIIASGVGSCNSHETKYYYRNETEITDKPLPKEYWKNKDVSLLGGKEYRPVKANGKWMLGHIKKVKNDNPWDLDNTIIKMACKRALVAATLNATAASDIFTQDLEDLPGDQTNTSESNDNEQEQPPAQSNHHQQAPPPDKKNTDDKSSEYLQCQARISSFASKKYIRSSDVTKIIHDAAVIKTAEGYDKAISFFKQKIDEIESGIPTGGSHENNE